MLAPTLPDLNRLDREALLKLLVAEHDERLAIHQRLLARETEIEHLKLLLAKLRRMQFGPALGEDRTPDRAAGTSAGGSGVEAG